MSAFAQYSKLESLTIPDSALEIGTNAFAACTNLQSLTMLSGTIEIGPNAFQYSALKNVSIPTDATTISNDVPLIHCDGTSCGCDVGGGRFQGAPGEHVCQVCEERACTTATRTTRLQCLPLGQVHHGEGRIRGMR